VELDLGAVRAFVAVVDELRFGAAADLLGLTQQAVSKRVAKLEAALGATLLDRAPTGTVLTKDGATFLPHARALVALARPRLVVPAVPDGCRRKGAREVDDYRRASNHSSTGAPSAPVTTPTGS
jgi:regulatory helix-turn-helix LysR family protein